MSVFEQRLTFRMFYFMTNDHQIIVKYRLGSGCAVSSAVGSWRNLCGDSVGKGPENFWSFYIWKANKYLKIEET